MKKSMNKNQILEIVIYFCMLFLFILHFYFISLGINTYHHKRGISLIGLNFIITIIFIIIFLLLILLLKWITKPKEVDYEAIHTKIKKFYQKRKWVVIPTVLLAFLLTAFLVIFSIQEMFLFFPNHNELRETLLSDYPEVTKININDDENIYSGWGHFDENNEYTIIYFGGNSEASARHVFNHAITNFSHLDYANFVMVDYPGYGLSRGKIDEKTFKKMALSVYDFVAKNAAVNPNKIIVMGYSLGSGMAAYVAANRTTYKLILLTPYTSIRDVANDMMPIFKGPFKWLWKNEFNTYELLDQISAKTLVIYTETDETIRPELSIKVINKFTNKQVYITDVKIHNRILYSELVWQEIKRFITN